jgi:formamidopyrimidine-DNA glycosylase
MPELPDVEVYREALERHLLGRELRGLRLRSTFLLRTVEPAPETLLGRRVRAVLRLGKRLVLEFEGQVCAVLHLMIAGRLRWRAAGAAPFGRALLLALDFDHGSLLLTEAGTKRRAALHLVHGERGLEAHRRGGLDLLQVDLVTFRARLAQENRTLKRALCDPAICDGVGNAYSDEILHRARLSPFLRTAELDGPRAERLLGAAREVLQEWTQRLRTAVGDGFPETVTAFHPQMAVHGKYGEPCPVCAAPVQRVVFAENELNYCPGCQTEGRILADRALSRLLKDDWPRNLDEL